MSLKDTCKEMKSLLDCILGDLDKAEEGNKAASQSVRTCTIRLEKVAKSYRKESVKSEKSGGGKKKAAKKKPAAKKKVAPKKKPAVKKAPAKKRVVKKAPAKKAAPKKRATAKLPKKRKK